MARHYTGIGAHATPEDVLDLMEMVARHLAAQGYVLRSGGSPGADMAFERGCGTSPKEIYLPSLGFNNNASPLIIKDDMLLRIASSLAWNALRAALRGENSPLDLDTLPDDRRRLYARDVCQILGADLQTPSERVICWTPPTGEREGTRIALYIARFVGVPIDNLADPHTFARWWSAVR